MAVVEPEQFVVAGLLNAVDVPERRLRVGAHDMWATPQLQLGGLQPGIRIVVNGHRERSAGRPLAERVIVPLSASPAEPATGAPLADEPDSATAAPRILPLVVSLLVELRLEVQALECAILPPSDLYAIRLEIPGERGKAVLLPRRALERAQVDASALRAVRNLLRAGAEILRSQRSAGNGAAAWYIAGLGTPARWSGPRCIRCEGPLFAEEPLVLEGESRWHVACPPAW